MKAPMAQRPPSPGGLPPCAAWCPFPPSSLTHPSSPHPCRWGRTCGRRSGWLPRGLSLGAQGSQVSTSAPSLPGPHPGGPQGAGGPSHPGRGGSMFPDTKCPLGLREAKTSAPCGQAWPGDWDSGFGSEAELRGGVTSAHGSGRKGRTPQALGGPVAGSVQLTSGWGSGGVQADCRLGGPSRPRLTIELLPEEREEDSEVDGTLPLLQHGIQLLFWHAHLPWWGWGTRWMWGSGRLPLLPSHRRVEKWEVMGSCDQWGRGV